MRYQVGTIPMTLAGREDPIYYEEEVAIGAALEMAKQIDDRHYFQTAVGVWELDEQDNAYILHIVFDEEVFRHERYWRDRVYGGADGRDADRGARESEG